MASKNDNVEAASFIWTDEYVGIFCELCIQFITKHGRGQSFKWREIQEQFESRTKRKPHLKSFKNKFDSMKRDWRLWKFLRNGETGLGWDSTTGKLDCSNEWWDRKIKEKHEAKKFHNKAIHPSIEEQWDHLFGDAVATGIDCIAPSVNPEYLNEEEPVNIEDEDNERDVNLVDDSDAYSIFSQYSSPLESLEKQENGFWQNFVNSVGGNNVDLPTPRTSSTPNSVSKETQLKKSTTTTTKSKELKRKRRQSAGSVMIKHHLDKVSELQANVIGLLTQGTPNANNNANGSSVEAAMEIMNRLAANGGLEEGGDLWCYAICVLRDLVNREMFLKMENDGARLSWLKFVHAKNIL